jgi:hypothetical protein
MKKRLFTLVGVCILSFGSFAQVQAVEADGVAERSTRPANHPMADNNERALPFWTEDFAGGIPATWTIDDSSGICPWTYSTDGTWGFFNGNSGTGPGATITSTTAANGFMICDIDSANNAAYGQPSGSMYQYLSSYIQTGAIDCSSEPAVILSFEHLYRYNNGVPMFVQVSNDNITWTSYDVSDGLANNTISADPVTKTINITSVAGSQATVFIRFGWSARVYFWQIDDISLSGADPFDVAMVDSWWGMGTLGYQHYKIPMSHAAPITFTSVITNNTGATLTGCATDIDVTGTSGSVYTGVGNSLDLPAAFTDTVISTTTWMPTVEDDYDVTFTATTTAGTDANTTNNGYPDALIITTSVYGLDNLTDPSQSTGSISNFSSNTGLQFKIGNLHQVTNDDLVECVQIGIADVAQNDGKAIYGEVYAYNPSTQLFDLRGYTDNFDITAGDLGTIVSLPMLQPGDVYADEEILVVAGHYGGDLSGTDDVAFMYGQSVPDQMVYGFNGAGDVFWLSNPRAIVCRADFSCGLGIAEAKNDIDIIAYPNPASDELNIRIDATLSTATLTLIDLNGRVVASQSIGSGVHDAAFNTAVLANGMYTLRVLSNELVSTLKVEVSH